MDFKKNVRNLEELNEQILVYIDEGFNIVHKNDNGATLTKNSINWMVLIALIIIFCPGALLYIILYKTGDFGKKEFVYLKIVNDNSQGFDAQNSFNKSVKTPIIYKQDEVSSDNGNINTNSINTNTNTNNTNTNNINTNNINNNINNNNNNNNN